MKAEVEAALEAEKKRRKKKKPPTATLADIQVKLEALQSIPMEEVFKIAEKASKAAEAKRKQNATSGANATKKTSLQPIDRVVAFLQQTAKLE